MSISETTAKYVLETMRPRFEAEGFDVFLQPSPAILPVFMRGYRPDAIAVGPHKKIAIEVVRPLENAEKIARLQQLIDQHRDWELQVVRVPPSSQAIDVSSHASIQQAVARAAALKRGGHVVPALIMAWAALEAIARALLPDKFARPQTPDRLVELVAHEGYLAPDDADIAWPLIASRHMLIHGALDATVDEAALDRFIAIIGRLADMVPPVDRR